MSSLGRKTKYNKRFVKKKKKKKKERKKPRPGKATFLPPLFLDFFYIQADWLYPLIATSRLKGIRQLTRVFLIATQVLRKNCASHSGLAMLHSFVITISRNSWRRGVIHSKVMEDFECGNLLVVDSVLSISYLGLEPYAMSQLGENFGFCVNVI